MPRKNMNQIFQGVEQGREAVPIFPPIGERTTPEDEVLAQTIGSSLGNIFKRGGNRLLENARSINQRIKEDPSKVLESMAGDFGLVGGIRRVAKRGIKTGVKSL